MIERGAGLSEESTEDAHFYQQDDAGVEHAAYDTNTACMQVALRALIF